MTDTHDTTACIVWPMNTADPESIHPDVPDPHVTIVFLGQTENLPSAEEIVNILKGKTYRPDFPYLALEEHAVYGRDVKFDVFLVEKRDDLLAMRQEMVNTLAEAGIKDASSFPDYSPHITLGPEGSDRWIASRIFLESPVLWYNGSTYQIDDLPVPY